MKEIRECVICMRGGFLCKTTDNRKTCSTACSRKYSVQYQKEYHSRPAAREYQKKYRQRPEIKQYKKELNKKYRQKKKKLERQKEAADK